MAEQFRFGLCAQTICVIAVVLMGRVPTRAQCPTVVLNSSLPRSTFGTFGSDVTRCASCTCSVVGETTFSYKAPLAGSYTFTAGSGNYDVVLSIRSGSCSGSELACRDASASGGTEQATVTLAADQMVYIYVQKYGSPPPRSRASVPRAIFDFSLSITGPCRPATNLGRGTTFSQTGSTSGTSAMAGTCRSETANFPERAYVFTAPRKGVYAIDTQGSALNTVLYARAGNACGGTEVDCDDDGLANMDSTLPNLALEDGDQLYVVVDGYNAAGSYNLHINGPSCPSPIELGSPTSVSRTDGVSGPGVLSNEVAGGDCTVGEGQGPEKVFHYTAPVTGTYRIDTNNSAVSDTVLHIRQGNSCSGTQLACDDDNGIPTNQSSLSQTLESQEDVFIVVDTYSAQSSGNVNLHIAGPSCPSATNLGSTLPLTTNGSTANGTDVLRASQECDQAGGGPERTFLYTAPATGTYTFEITQADFDTVLAVHDSACSGNELKCHDDIDDGDTRSIASLPLSGGQQVYLVVDSYAGGGNFTMRVTGQTTPTPTIPPPFITPTPTPSRSATPSATGTSSRSPTPTSTTTPSWTPANSATSSPTRTPTASSTPSATPTATQTLTSAATYTATHTPFATFTLTPSPSVTATVSPTNTATASPSHSPTATPTVTVSMTSTASASAVATSTPTLTPTAPASTATGTPTHSPSQTALPTSTATLTTLPSSTATLTPVPSSTPTNFPTGTPSSTERPTGTPTMTAVATFSATPTATQLPCIGDCDGSGDVTLTELLRCRRVVLVSGPTSLCPVCRPRCYSDRVAAGRNYLQGGPARCLQFVGQCGAR